MRRLLAVVGVFALTLPLSAQPPKGEQAKRLAEEVEAIEAHLVTKKAYIAAARVTMKAAE